MRINPQLDSAAENLADLREERVRRGMLAESMLPTFDCKQARHAVEKAICSDPDLARLDRQIDDAYKAALARRDRKTIGQRSRRSARIHRRPQQVSSASPNTI